MKNIKTIFLAGAALMMAASAQASEMHYQPVNPNFGGDPFNGSFLMSNAQSQNGHQKPEVQTDSLKNFERTITSSLLSRISFQIADSMFGDNAQSSGQYQLGDTLLSFQRNGNNVDVTIFDGVTGGQTKISVPAPELKTP